MEQEKQRDDGGYAQLSAAYDSPKEQTFMDFYAQEDSLYILYNAYNKIIHNKNIDYYEFAGQDLTYIGDFKGDISLVNGFDESFINQKINDETITPLKAIQISKKVIKENNLDAKLSVGEAFTDDDYNLPDTREIQVIMGANFESLFNINEKFKAYYLGKEKFTCTVKGFYKPGTILNIAGIEDKVDNFIVFPSYDLSEEQLADSRIDKFLKNVLLTNKLSGYIKYENYTEKEKEINEIKNIADTTGYKYNIDILKNYNYSEEIEPIVSYSTALLLYILAMVIFITSLIVVYIIWYKKTQDISSIITKRDRYIYKSKIFFNFSIIYVVSYLIASVLSNNIFNAFGYENFKMIYLVYQNTGIYLLYIITLKLKFIIVNIQLKKKNKFVRV